MYTKTTFIYEVTKKPFEPMRSFTMSGHASEAGIRSKAIKRGFKFPLKADHVVFDESGKGYGGTDLTFYVREEN